MRKLNLLAMPSVKVARWYLSLEYYWAVIALLLIPAVFSETQAYLSPTTKRELQLSGLHNIDDFSLGIKWAVIKLAGFSGFFLFLNIIRVLLRTASIKSLKAWQLSLIAIFGGLFNGLTQHFLMDELDVFESGTHFARIVSPVTLSVVLLFSLSALTSNVRRYRLEHSKAEKELAALRKLQNQQLDFLAGYQDLSSAVPDEITATTNEALFRLEELQASQHPLDRGLANQIRLISDSTIRDLSHQIAASYSSSEQKVQRPPKSRKGMRFLDLFRDSINFAPLNPLAFTFAFVLIFSSVMIRHADWTQAIFMATGCFIVIYFTQVIGVYLYRIFGWQNIFTVTATILFSSTLPFICISRNFLNFRALVPAWKEYPPAVGLFFFSITAVTLVGYVQQAGLLASEDIVKRRSEAIINAKLVVKPFNKEIVQISRNWARHLHGRVQSQILAATFSLEKAQDAGDLDGVQKAFEQISNVLLRADKIEEFDNQSLESEIKNRIQQWSGIIEVAIQISSEVGARTGLEVHIIADVVEEMITNASRHGAASKISIKLLQRTSSQLRIEATDNGAHFDPQNKGFGSRFFDEVSEGRWDISRSKANAQTTVSMLFTLENL